MHLFRAVLIVTGVGLFSPWIVAGCSPGIPDSREAAPVSLQVLAEQATLRVVAPARIQLAPNTLDVFQKIDGLDIPTTGRVPNYLRALAALPASVQPFAHLIRTVLYSGVVEPEVKMAMGLRMGQITGSPYVAAHLRRFLGATDRGRVLLKQVTAEDLEGLEPADLLAIRYAEWLTRNIHGVSDEDFQMVRGYFSDGQVVELTLTVSFFNYFTRLVEALNLPVEPWALESDFTAPAHTFSPPEGRVHLISDRQMEWAAGTVASRSDASAQQSGLGLGLANSQRAMLLSPDIALAWRSYSSSVGEGAVVSREIKLHVSFAVSMANGCRYCTLHQVQGLRRLGVSMDKLMQMKKDDSELTPRELTAVEFARKLTREPSAMTDADYTTLSAEFGKQGALEVVLQTCAFAFMNRFTDGLRLPSEDEAVRVYREVYGADWDTPRQP